MHAIFKIVIAVLSFVGVPYFSIMAFYLTDLYGVAVGMWLFFPTVICLGIFAHIILGYVVGEDGAIEDA